MFGRLPARGFQKRALIEGEPAPFADTFGVAAHPTLGNAWRWLLDNPFSTTQLLQLNLPAAFAAIKQ